MTHPEICNVFDLVLRRLASHNIDLDINSTFVLSSKGEKVTTTDTVDGLMAFADALDFARAE